VFEFGFLVAYKSDPVMLDSSYQRP
jgi:hypothetical protein